MVTPNEYTNILNWGPSDPVNRAFRLIDVSDLTFEDFKLLGNRQPNGIDVQYFTLFPNFQGIPAGQIRGQEPFDVIPEQFRTVNDLRLEQLIRRETSYFPEGLTNATTTTDLLSRPNNLGVLTDRLDVTTETLIYTDGVPTQRETIGNVYVADRVNGNSVIEPIPAFLAETFEGITDLEGVDFSNIEPAVLTVGKRQFSVRATNPFSINELGEISGDPIDSQYIFSASVGETVGLLALKRASWASSEVTLNQVIPAPFAFVGRPVVLAPQPPLGQGGAVSTQPIRGYVSGFTISVSANGGGETINLLRVS